MKIFLFFTSLIFIMVLMALWFYESISAAFLFSDSSTQKVPVLTVDQEEGIWAEDFITVEDEKMLMELGKEKAEEELTKWLEIHKKSNLRTAVSLCE